MHTPPFFSDCRMPHFAQFPDIHSFLQERQSSVALQVCGNNSWLIPLGLSLPYLWRFCQCIRVNKDTGNTAQLYNALKYSTAFPVVLFSYMNYHTDEQTWATFYRPLWVLSALLNSAYSYYWDVERDWDVQWFSAPAGGDVASLSFISISSSFSICRAGESQSCECTQIKRYCLMLFVLLHAIV